MRGRSENYMVNIGERSEPMQLGGSGVWGGGGALSPPPPTRNFFEEMNMIWCILMPYKYEYVDDMKGKG